jgi:F-type H+-transporting ATPase subunit epsilon
MTKTIHCDIVSAHEEIYSGEATMIIASGVAGELGITPRHTPLITQLKAGSVRVLQANGEEAFFFVSSGILEVQPHMVTILTDTAMRGDDLDEAAAKAAKAEAERQLADRGAEMDIAEAQAQLMQAVAQLAALEQLRKKLKR